MYGYAGLYAMTPDLHCILGPVSDLRGFYLACGFSGHGLMHAPAVGLILAEWITRGKLETLDAKALQLDRFDKGETIVESFQI
jgi:sarcosine oxidase subunit beta